LGWIRCYQQGKKAFVIDEVVYYWRRHANNISYFLADRMPEVLAYYKSKLNI